MIHPIPSQDLWPQFLKTEMLKPPKIKRLPGRPKKGRRNDPLEKKIPPKRLMKPKWNCSRCNQLGHNTRSFTNEPVPKKPKDKPGRPRKSKQGSSKTNEVGTSGTIFILKVISQIPFTTCFLIQVGTSCKLFSL